MNIHEQWLQVQGLRVHGFVAGDQGSPVMLLHGGGVDSALLSWELLIPVLAQRHRVFAADWPGYGDSDKPKVKYAVAYYVQFLEALMGAFGLQRASLAGLSMGGSIALGFTLRQPHRVDKLVLVDSYGLQTQASMHKLSYFLVKLPLISELSYAMLRGSRAMTRASLSVLLCNPQSITDGLVDEAFAEIKKPGAGQAWSVFQKEEMLWNGTRTCFMDRLAEIVTPTLIVHGRQDQAVPLKCAQQAHVRIKSSRLEILDGCGHWPQRDRPDEFNRIVVEFLAD
jgi:pimeloyl-ACP methyl ester carboxylesterase